MGWKMWLLKRFPSARTTPRLRNAVLMPTVPPLYLRVNNYLDVRLIICSSLSLRLVAAPMLLQFDT